MARIDCIKEKQAEGRTVTEIAEIVGVDRKTVRKYMGQEDFSPRSPTVSERASKLDRYKPEIDGWLSGDRRNWYKQRHTARRIHRRLQERYGEEYTCSYPLVQRYVKQVRQRLQEDRTGFQELVWHAGEAQVDFGEVACDGPEGVSRRSLLVLYLPHSNAGFDQLYDGETAECVVEGLQEIFRHLGGVPTRLVFDNATGVGRRVSETVRYAELFLRFKAHCGFRVTFCNPDAGHEKGAVEAKVGYERRNRFVPVPYVDDDAVFNRSLLERAGVDFDRPHYRKGRPIRELLEEDRAALLPLPEKPFEACRYERVKTDGYGKFCLDGCHHYATSPEHSQAQLYVRIGARTVEPLDAEGRPLHTYRRRFGKTRTDSLHPRATLPRLIRSPGAWPNSQLRETLGPDLRAEMDLLDRTGLREVLRTLDDLGSRFGFETALQALEEASRAGRLQQSTVEVLALRISTLGLLAEPSPGPDLAVYDRMLLGKEADVHADR